MVDMAVLTIDEREVITALGSLKPKVEKWGQKVLDSVGLDVRWEIISQMHNSMPSGTIYYRSNGSFHQASAPGEPPAPDTGRLMNSVVYNTTAPLEVTVSSDVEYAWFLEYGTVHIAPRPVWEPAADKFRPVLLRRMRRVIKRGLESG